MRIFPLRLNQGITIKIEIMKHVVVLLLLFVFIPAGAQKDTKTFVDASDSNYTYVGRFDFSDKKQPVFMYSGCMIRTVFEGSSVEMVMKDDSLRNLFTVIIDDNLSVLKTNKKSGRYLLAGNLKKGTHTLEIIRRTEWHCGNTAFLGLYLEKGRNLTKPEVKPRRIEFIGDSYTCGYGNEGKSNKEHFNYETENNFMTFGAISARMLDADYLMVCRSGIGMFQGYGGGKDFTMPQFYDEVVLHNSLRWDFSLYQPQLVVIDLGGNDLSAKLDTAQFVKAYLTFLSRLRRNYPDAKIVCVAGPSDTGDEWQNWRSLIHTVVNQGRSSDKDVYYFEFSTFEPSGSDWHPNVAQHSAMADELEPFLEALMDW
jgi:hypothetical protein